MEAVKKFQAMVVGSEYAITLHHGPEEIVGVLVSPVEKTTCGWKAYIRHTQGSFVGLDDTIYCRNHREGDEFVSGQVVGVREV